MTTTARAPSETAAAAADAIGGTEDPGGLKVSEGLMALAKAATHGGAAVKAGVGF